MEEEEKSDEVVEVEQEGDQAEKGESSEASDERLRTLKNRLEEKEAALEEKEKRIKELQERVKRARADFENYKKRQKKAQKEAKEKAKEKVFLEFLPIYDNLDRAFKNFNKNEDKESFIEGVEKIYAQFDDLLEKQEIEPIEAKGKSFNPRLHEALMRVNSEEHEHNVIIEEFERGYRRDGEVLRPSKVKVNISPTGEKSDRENRENSPEDD